MITAYGPYLLSKSNCKNLTEAVSGQDALVLITAHREFLDAPINLFSNTIVFLDGRNSFMHKRASIMKNDTTYIGIGI